MPGLKVLPVDPGVNNYFQSLLVILVLFPVPNLHMGRVLVTLNLTGFVVLLGQYDFHAPVCMLIHNRMKNLRAA